MRTFFAISFSLAFAAGILADYNTVITDITNLGNAVSILDNDTMAVLSGVAGVPYVLQVEVDAVNLDNLINDATSDAKVSAPFGDTGSSDVSSAIINPTPTIQKGLADVAAKNTTFGELGPIVLSSLYQLKQDTDAFGKAVIAKLTPAFQGAAPVIITQIDGYFNSAIAAYGGKSEFYFGLALHILF